MSGPEPTARPPTFPPDRLLQGTYRVGQRLATGGMGEVYVARHERLGSDVAVKVLSRALVDDQAARARFFREAGILSVCRHPHIVQVFDFNITEEGIPYLVMELLEGPTLAELLAQSGAMPPRKVARVVRQVAGALQAAHERGIVHRDLKPDNVIVLQPAGGEEFAKVLDFGICRTLGAPRLTTDATVLGTPEYMAPEQARGDELDVRTDEFALAAMGYALLSGRQPFQGDRPMSVLYQIVHEDPQPIGPLVDFPADEIEAVLRRGLAKDRDRRFPSVTDFAAALEAAVERLDATAGAAPAPPPRGPTPVSIEVAPVEVGAPREDCSAVLAVTDGRRRRPRRRWALPGLAVSFVAGLLFSYQVDLDAASGRALVERARRVRATTTAIWQRLSGAPREAPTLLKVPLRPGEPTPPAPLLRR